MTVEDLKSKFKFVVIGGQKCGTTFIDSILIQSKKIDTPYLKETDFFSNNYDKGLKYYSNYFKNSKAEIVGEISGLYMQKLTTAQNILKSFPNIKIIIIARNPIDAVVSGYYHMIQRKKDIGLNKYIENISEDNNWFLRWKYYAHVNEYLNISKNKVNPKVLFFDDIVKNRQKLVKDLFSILDIMDYDNISYHKTEKNIAKKIRFDTFGTLMHKSYIYIRKYNLYRLRKIIDILRIKDFLYKSITEKETLHKINKGKLINIFIDDIKLLEKYSKRDLSDWYNL